MENKIFISHTHADEPIAQAIDHAIEELFGPRSLEIVYSTKRGLGRIRPGEDWYQWIVRQVQESRVALVLFTPTSIHKPWLYWEAGAVYGSALVEESAGLRRVRPLLFGLRRTEVPPTFPTTQAARGDSAEGIQVVLEDLFEDFGGILPRQVLLEAGRRMPGVIQQYLETVESALRRAPLAPTEENVQEWCSRLDRLRTEDRVSEVCHVHNWLNVAFGFESTNPQPIDLRLHRRLGELYLDIREYEQAAVQFELARRLVPRDIFILRALGQALLGAGKVEKVSALIEDITRLDPNAFVNNVECAALKGRWLLQQNRFDEALAAYEQAFSRNSASYYLADLLGQARLAVGDLEGARLAYERALNIIERLRERNIWVEATAATAALVTGNPDATHRHLAAIAAYQPTQENLEAIERGLRRCHKSLGGDDTRLGALLAALH